MGIMGYLGTEPGVVYHEGDGFRRIGGDSQDVRVDVSH